MSESMCGCGCSFISSLMKRLSRTACCSDLLSCSHTSEQLHRLATDRPRLAQSWIKGPAIKGGFVVNGNILHAF
ncbi:unnamed protein product [Arctogadus glacialis]